VRVGLLLVIAACATRSQPAMVERSGDLFLSCDPTDSEVWLDGYPVGNCADFSGRRGLSLEKRMSKVEVRKDGYRTFETFVEPDGTRAALSVTLAPSTTGGGP